MRIRRSRGFWGWGDGEMRVGGSMLTANRVILKI